MKNYWLLTAAVALVLGTVGYTLAQSTGPQDHMMGPGMMGDRTVAHADHGAAMEDGAVPMMNDESLTPEQLEEIARQHGITLEEAKQMVEACSQMTADTPESQEEL